MKRRFISMVTVLALLAGLMPAAMAAGEAEEVTWLLPEDCLVEERTDDDLSGGLAPGEGAIDFPRDPEGITGTRNVLVVPIRFADEEEFLTEQPEQYGGRTVEELIGLTYSGTDVSVQAYYDHISFGALDMNPVWLLEEGGSIRLPHERGYYMPRSLDNEAGYLMHLRGVRIFDANGRAAQRIVYVPELACTRDADDVNGHVALDEETGELLAICTHMDVQARQRGSRLELVWRGGMSDAHSWEDSSCFYTEEYNDRSKEFRAEVYVAINARAQEQEIRDIDCTTIWFSGDVTDWGSLLWPHQSGFTAFGPTYYRAGADKLYIALLTEDSFSWQATGHLENGGAVTLPETGSLAHELGHMLGFPDYYSYYDVYELYLGTWSLMEQVGSVPQNIHGWASYIYGGWLDEDNVREITREGAYTITTISGATKEEREGGAAYLYYIRNPAGDPDYPEQIVLEYRSPRGVFEQSHREESNMPVPGLILYSVDDEAERQLGGNINATGKDGRYGAKLYYTSGQGEPLAKNYAELSEVYQQLFDMLAAPLTDRELTLKNGDIFPAHNSYGSADPEATGNVLTSRRTGANSGIVICGAAIDPADPAQMTFWVDLKAPEIYDIRDDRRLGVRTVTVTYDEPVTAGPGLEQITSTAGTLEAQMEGQTLTLTITGTEEALQVILPADTVLDQAGRTMEEVTLTLKQADRHAVFYDVSAEHWARPAILAVTDAGLLRGVTGTLFAPEDALTRGALVTVLGRLAGAGTEKGETGFSDVDPHAWYAPYVKWAADNGILDGSEDGIFAPGETIRREQLAVVLANYLNWLGYEIPTAEGTAYADESAISPWALDAVYAVRAAGLMEGKEGERFDPAGMVTRAQMAQVLWKCMELN